MKHSELTLHVFDLLLLHGIVSFSDVYWKIITLFFEMKH